MKRCIKVLYDYDLFKKYRVCKNILLKSKFYKNKTKIDLTIHVRYRSECISCWKECYYKNRDRLLNNMKKCNKENREKMNNLWKK